MTSLTAVSEVDRLDPPPAAVLALVGGLRVRLLRLRMRQLFRLLRIITRGGAQYLPMLREVLAGASEGTDAAEAFGAQLLAVALLALPEAEDEAVEFLGSVVEPVGLTRGSDKASRAHDEGLSAALATELYNPDPADVVTIIEAVIVAERDDLVALGKRLAASWGMADKTGALQTPTPPSTPPPSPPSESTAPTRASSAPSPDPSTSSPPPTGGPTTSSAPSPSPG